MAHRGFSLLELLIVITIISILSTTALFSYRTYTIRAHVAEGIQLSSQVKAAIYEYRHNFGLWPASNSSVNISLNNSINGNATRSVTINNGVITILYRTQVGSGQSIVFTPTINNIGSIEWQCKSGSTVPAKYRPINCR
ncbi:MAG: hypothetical protein RLZZ215_617 [Pseudomonadota bacterium]|jgi:type IV pilus assembly protein PilA